MALHPGRRLGTYEILALLGTGGMGEVYRARDLRLGREVAIKVLPPDVASHPDRLARFEREARTVAGLNHPNIVTLFSLEDEDGVRFLTMELIEGQSLSTLVAPQGTPLARLLELAIPLADALAAAHARRVVHRDLKPANVMVTREGRVKVLDFGLAKLVEEAKGADRSVATMETPISGEGLVLGTIPYMAPEQIRGQAIDARSDLFALGVLLYELAAGRRPFVGATPADISSSILRDTPDPLTRIRADLPAPLEHLVNRCLEKNPRDRIQTALEASNELRAIRRELERKLPGDAEKVASIAVLPFVNRSASADDEYFSDGLADELLHMLAKIRGLRVAARTSAFSFKGKEATVAEIGSALRVAAILEGSVRKAGDRVRISVQLVKVSDGFHLWSETYDRTLEDIFAVQDEIAHAVVKELRTTLLGEDPDSDASRQAKSEVASAARGRGTNPEAHRLLLLARYFIDRGDRESFRKALDYLNRAVELDPDFAIAWAELCRAYTNAAHGGWVPLEEGYDRARKAVERAMALEPDIPEVHARIGWIQSRHDWDWARADTSYARALELAPRSDFVLAGAAGLAMDRGRFDEAVTLFHRALEQDPLRASAYHSLGLALQGAGRWSEAEAAFRKALELAPQRAVTRACGSLAILAQGRSDEALSEASREPEEAFRLWARCIIEASRGRRAESDAAYQAVVGKYADAAAYQIAEMCAARGEADAAFEWLDRAYAQRDGGLAEMQGSYALRALHGDPRWAAFLRKMGFQGRSAG
ncbi:MAG: protein kinase domain-containing protein [Bacteroidota bacterium]